MSLEFEISEGLRKTLDKLASKDKRLAVAVHNKIAQIVRSDIAATQHFKNLRGNMSNLKRVHVGHFVLTFYVKEGKVFFERFVHHDKAY